MIPTARERAAHESAHAAALVPQGLTPLWARIDLPEDGAGGSVGIDWQHHDPTPENLRKVVIAALQGPIEDVELCLSAWPINCDDWDLGNRLDAELISFLVDRLALDQVDWLWLVHQAQSLGRQPEFRGLMMLIAAELERVEVLLQPEIESLRRQINGRRDG